VIKVYNSSTELVKYEFPKKIISPIYKIFENANIVYQDVIEDEFFKSEYVTNVKGRIMSYAIYRQFDSLYLPKNFPFKVKSVTMSFQQKRVELHRPNIILTIAKVNSRNTLPTVSNYRKKYASRNWGLGRQIYMDILDNNRIKLNQEPYYGIIVYNINNSSLEFVDIVIPDYKYERILERIELKPKFEVHKIEDIKDDEKRILGIENLKKEILDSKILFSDEGE
jgi:hypothetical protein